MSPKLKKFIIALVVVLILFIGAIVGYSVLAKLSTTIVYDLRILEVDTEKEIFEKDVYLCAEDLNKFDIKLDYGTSSSAVWVVESSDTSIAKITPNGRNYTVSYQKAGTVTITAHPSDGDAIKDSFVLNVKENYPISFVFDDEKAESDNEISMFADNKEYSFNFVAQSLNGDSLVNNDNLVLVDDYDKEVFEYIHIDPVNSKLIAKAKQSIDTIRETITIQSKSTGDDGQVFIKNFLVIINVQGNYIANLQLQLASNPNFEGDVYIYGEGLIKENEKKVSAVVFVPDVRTIYAKARAVYTNGDIFYITKDSIISTEYRNIDVQKIKPSEEFIILKADGSDSDTLKVARQDYAGDPIEFYCPLYFYNPSSFQYEPFEKSLYVEARSKTTGTFLYYEYVYWDVRYARTDVITLDGKIVGFINEIPEYNIIYIDDRSEEE